MSVSAPAIGWFAAHEARLAWRDLVALATAGRPRRAAIVVAVLAALGAGFQWWIAATIAPHAGTGMTDSVEVRLLVLGAAVMMASLMFSQALESVTRAYYARGDLDLLLTAPASTDQVFAVRSCVIALQTAGLSLVIVAPMVNALVWHDGPHWLAAYAVVFALAALATSGAIWTTLLLFRTAGPARTRLIAQIVAAIVGAAFIIAIQIVSIAMGSGLSRTAALLDPTVVAAVPGAGSFLWWPVRAASGDVVALAPFVALGLTVLGWTIRVSSKRFGHDALSTAGRSDTASGASRPSAGFARRQTLDGALMAKEWRLLARDPWLMSQSLQQILYLIPPALLLYVSYGAAEGTALVVVAFVTMAAGQLAGGLAWVTISGEDAHELIATAPVRPSRILAAKVKAVGTVVGLVIAPLGAGLAFFDPRAAGALIAGCACAAASTVAIQLWCRRQMNRSLFRRRQVSSRLATFGEAIVAILWAGAAAIFLVQPVLAAIPAAVACLALGLVYLMRPADPV